MSSYIEKKDMRIEYNYRKGVDTDEFGSRPWVDYSIESIHAYDKETDEWVNVTEDLWAIRAAERMIEEYEQDEEN